MLLVYELLYSVMINFVSGLYKHLQQYKLVFVLNILCTTLFQQNGCTMYIPT